MENGTLLKGGYLMQAVRQGLRALSAFALAVGLGAPAHATTLIRAGLDDLVAGNRTIVVGTVRSAHSYWNEEHNFILTDVRFDVEEVLKGDAKERHLTITILGGTVDDLTTVIVGGADLVPGKSYVLFLDEGDLPGVRNVRTVRDHSQGVFEVVKARDGLRAVSQASRQPLHPDALGFVDVPGEAQGLPLSSMIQSIREIAARQGKPGEVK
jgi:hypothetical protein